MIAFQQDIWLYDHLNCPVRLSSSSQHGSEILQKPSVTELLEMPLKCSFLDSIVIYTYNLSIWDEVSGRSGLQAYLWLHGEFKASLEYMRFLSQGNKQKKVDS